MRIRLVCILKGLSKDLKKKKQFKSLEHSINIMNT